MATEAVFSVLASCQGFYDYNYGCKHVRRDVLIILDFKDCRHFFCCLAFFLCFSEIVLGSADNSDHHETWPSAVAWKEVCRSFAVLQSIQSILKTIEHSPHYLAVSECPVDHDAMINDADSKACFFGDLPSSTADNALWVYLAGHCGQAAHSSAENLVLIVSKGWGYHQSDKTTTIDSITNYLRRIIDSISLSWFMMIHHYQLSTGIDSV